MNRRKLKQGLISVGIGFLVSVPIIHGAMASWEKSPQVTFESLPDDFSGLQAEEIEAKAHEIFEAEQRRQELIAVEQARMEQTAAIYDEAYETLEIYQVSVPEDIQLYCEAAQQESNVCAELLEALCWKESRFKPTASNAGCEGIAQISTKWHQDRMSRLGVSDIYDAEGNIRIAADYLSELFEKYDGDTYKVLMEYNGDTSEGVSDYAIEICQGPRGGARYLSPL